MGATGPTGEAGPMGPTGPTGPTGATGSVENNAGYELMLAEIEFLTDTRIDNVKVGNSSGRIVTHQNPLNLFTGLDVTLQRSVEYTCSDDPTLIDSSDWPCSEQSCPLSEIVLFQTDAPLESCVVRVKLVLTDAETAVETTLVSGWSNPITIS